MSFARAGLVTPELERARQSPQPRLDAASQYTGHREEWSQRLVPPRGYAPPRELAHQDKRDRSPGPQAYDAYGMDREVSRGDADREGAHRYHHSASSCDSPPQRLAVWDSALHRERTEAKFSLKAIAGYDDSVGSRSRRVGRDSTSLKRSQSLHRRASSSESPVKMLSRGRGNDLALRPEAFTYSDSDLAQLYDWRHAVAASSSAAVAEAAARTVAEANAEVARARRREKQLESQLAVLEKSQSKLQEANVQLATDLSRSSEVLERLEKEVSQLRKMQGRIDTAIEAAVLEERSNCDRRAQHEIAAVRAENAKLRKALLKSEPRASEVNKMTLESRLLALENRSPALPHAPHQPPLHTGVLRVNALAETAWDQAD